MVTLTLNITPPAGMNDNEALRLFCQSRGWTSESPETKNQFAKRVLAEEIRQQIRQQRRIEAEAALTVPDDVVVD
jgi:hypothetical protein